MAEIISTSALLERYHLELNNPATRWYYRRGRLVSSLTSYYAGMLRVRHRKTAIAILALPSWAVCKDVRFMLARAVMKVADEQIWTPPIPKLMMMPEWGATTRPEEEAIAHAKTVADAKVLWIIHPNTYANISYHFIPPAVRMRVLITKTVSNIIASGAFWGTTMLIITSADAQGPTQDIIKLLRLMSSSRRPFIFLIYTDDPVGEIKFQ